MKALTRSTETENNGSNEMSFEVDLDDLDDESTECGVDDDNSTESDEAGVDEDNSIESDDAGDGAVCEDCNDWTEGLPSSFNAREVASILFVQ